MQIPRNTFRDALRAGQAQIGFWLGFTDPNVAEALALCGAVLGSLDELTDEVVEALYRA